jgi:hypothetical protein
LGQRRQARGWHLRILSPHRISFARAADVRVRVRGRRWCPNSSARAAGVRARPHPHACRRCPSPRAPLVSELIRTCCRCPSSSSSMRAPPVDELDRRVMRMGSSLCRNYTTRRRVRSVGRAPNFRRVPTAAVSSTGWGKWHSLTDTARRNGRVAYSSRCVAYCFASCWRLKAWSVEKRWGPLVLCTTARRSPGDGLSGSLACCPKVDKRE